MKTTPTEAIERIAHLASALTSPRLTDALTERATLRRCGVIIVDEGLDASPDFLATR